MVRRTAMELGSLMTMGLIVLWNSKDHMPADN